jgi:TPM domain
MNLVAAACKLPAKGGTLLTFRGNTLMHPRFRWTFFLATICGCLFLTGSSGAVFVAPEIRDDGKFFSAAAVKKANEVIRDIYRHHDHDVLIETIATVPPADLAYVKAMDATQRAAYFLKWAKERSTERAVNGVYILLCKEPRHLLVGVDEKQPHKFAPGTREGIEKMLVKEFREGRFDEGLEQALRFIEEQLAKK